MILNSKSFSVIDRDKIKGNIHIVGVGALGGAIVLNLVRLNLASKIIVHDFDTVEEKNLNNQVYLRKHIGKLKVDALKDLCLEIDNDPIRTSSNKVEFLRTKPDDVIILCPDSFKARTQILKAIERPCLIITAGLSSIGGSVYRTHNHYTELSQEFEDLPEEIPTEDTTACGSPISIYHRIQIISGLVCEELLKGLKEKQDVKIQVDIPNGFLASYNWK